MSTTYYAVCNANGPISKRIAGPDETPQPQWIDDACTDAEDDLDINGEGMTPGRFHEALIEAGATLVRDADIWGDWQVFAIDRD